MRAMENGTPQLIARDLRRSFRMGPRRIEVLRGISMEVRRSEAVFLVGASGAGKTTLLYTLAGLERPEGRDGGVRRAAAFTPGSSQAQAHIRNTQMGFVFQSYFLLPELTALENVMLPGMIGGRVRESAAEESLRRSWFWANGCNICRQNFRVASKQRVAIARALVNDPAIVFADEPTGNLDSKTGDAIMDLLLSLARERKKTLLVVTHDPRLAALGIGSCTWWTGCWSSAVVAAAVSGGRRVKVCAGSLTSLGMTNAP